MTDPTTKGYAPLDNWPDPNWRDTQDDPCTCSPGDGTRQCPREAECFEAFSAAQEAAR